MSTTETLILRIAMLIYPKVTLLDIIGPQQVLAGLPDTVVDIIAKEKAPVVTDRKVSINPDKSFAECTDQYDVIVIPGGSATHEQLEDAETVEFVAKIGKTAKYVTAVCTGSLILAAAGLLNGYRANSHWAFRHLLPKLGATLAEGRVVVDRNRITGGGVTAGIDFGFQVAATLKGEEVAKLMTLALEYDPKAPFTTGTPDRADKQTLERARTRLGAMVGAMESTIDNLVAQR
jgi:cyclohexyl-isocyanide hydratase